MSISLIICTRNRADRLAPCLDALANLRKASGLEIVLVDNGSTDDTRRILAEFKCPFPVRLVYEPAPGLGRARNAGLRNSSGDIVVFTDDDCYVDPDFATEVERLFADNPALGFFGGRIMLHDPTDLPVTIKESMVTETFAPFEFLPAGSIHGANFGFRRSVITSLGGFDEHLGAGTNFAAEDIEMVGRAVGAGFEGMYSPGPVVSHHHRRKLPSDLQSLSATYDVGRGAYYVSMLRNAKLRWQALRYWQGTYHLTRNPQSMRVMVERLWRELAGASGYLFATWFVRPDGR